MLDVVSMYYNVENLITSLSDEVFAANMRISLHLLKWILIRQNNFKESIDMIFVKNHLM